MTVRDAIVANALWGVANEPQIHYSQGSRRFAAVNSPRSLPLYTDCSGFATLCYAWAGAADPNGMAFQGGYTGTLLNHLPEISLMDAQPGDLIVYGPGVGDHVVIVVESGSDPMTVSHGQEAGPIRVRHSVEARAHRGPVTVLNGLAGPSTPPVTPPSSGEFTMDNEAKAAIADLAQRLQMLQNEVWDDKASIAGRIDALKTDFDGLATNMRQTANAENAIRVMFTDDGPDAKAFRAKFYAEMKKELGL